MNTYLKSLLGCCLATTAWTQGQIVIANRIQTLDLDAPVFDADCATRLEGAAYAAQLYVGLERDSLAPYGPILGFQAGVRAGYIEPRIVTFPPEMTGPKLYFRLCVWDVAAGASFEAAVSSGGKYGTSNLLRVGAYPPPGGPEYLVGLQSFCLVPEAAPATFLALGGAALVASSNESDRGDGAGAGREPHGGNAGGPAVLQG